MIRFFGALNTLKIRIKFLILLGAITELAGCAADLSALISAPSKLTKDQIVAQGLKGTKILFNYQDFYTVVSPNPGTGCPGDIINFYDYLAANPVGATPRKLTSSVTNPNQTVRPSFIKNISVDLTDSNSTSPRNAAMSCSYGPSSGGTAASSCSAFDWSATLGTDSALGGQLLILGGTQSNNATSSSDPIGYTLHCDPNLRNCNPLLASMAINSLPSTAAGTSQASGILPSPLPSTGISTWSNLTDNLNSSSTPTSFTKSKLTWGTTPQGISAAASTFDLPAKNLLIFGGSSYRSSSTGSRWFPTTFDTWTLNSTTGQWTSIASLPTIADGITQAFDSNSAALSATTQLIPINRRDQGRALFGMTATTGMAISQLGTSGNVGASHPLESPPINSPIDTTERILITGGLCNNSSLICSDTLKFNPTYGPEHIDALKTDFSIKQNIQTGPDQWIDSYHTQTMSNTAQAPSYPSQLSPYFPTPSLIPSPPIPNTLGQFGTYGFGMVPIMNTSSGPGQPITGDYFAFGAGSNPTAATGPNTPGASYLLTAGGFYGFSGAPPTSNTPAGPCTNQQMCGGLNLFLKWSEITNTAAEAIGTNFISLANFIDPNASQAAPGNWSSYTDTSLSPWFGAGVLVKGLKSLSNDVVYFGGSTCSDFLNPTSAIFCAWDTTGASGPASPTNVGKYYQYGTPTGPTLPGNILSAAPTTTTAMIGTLPTNAGMAAARGLDPEGNPLVVAWGGMSSRNKIDSSSAKIYYLYDNNSAATPTTAPTPTWGSDSAPSSVTGGPPNPLVHASLVFSHVTGKFYIFGGYDPSITAPASNAVANTWELSFSITSPRNCGITGGCKFTWRQLTPSCYPNCTQPPARWGHRSVEANYHYFNAPYEPSCSDKTKPCSFGIFMEGGQASNTLQFLSDRWMFDPTGNPTLSSTGTLQPQGHWQLMGELPPRSFASMTQIDYQTISGQNQHIGLLFGGETGLQNPSFYSSGNYYVPPTLGDTWMYDFNTSAWNRVKLLGARYNTWPKTTLSQVSSRAGSSTTDPTTYVLTPPPLSGSIMVTRTLSRPNHLVTDSAQNLQLPEVFLIGGRNKEGKYNPFSQVYKFCAGSTGEKQMRAIQGQPAPSSDDASCDAYDPTLNPNSPNPQSGYVGRWLLKAPITPVSGISGSTPTPSQLASFLGAGAYDPLHDLIVVYGGLTAAPSASTTASFSSFAVTDSSQRSVNNSDGGIFEYTPPSKTATSVDNLKNGQWNYIPSCNASVPASRYGHSLVYDSTHQNLIMTGGFNVFGNLLTQLEAPNAGGSPYFIPEVWTATRIDDFSTTDPTTGLPSTNLGNVFPCYYWSQINQFGNQVGTRINQPLQTGVAHASTFYISPSGYNTGFYTLNGPQCASGGTVTGTDQNIGGIYIDIDRTQLNPSENLLLNVTLLPLGASNVDSMGDSITSAQSARFRVTLVQTGQNINQLLGQTQPRAVSYSDTSSYPIRAYDIANLAPPLGQIREEQIFVPLSMDPRVDRIRIERVSGSGIIFGASLARLKPNN